jgi:hypothetical protein
MRDPLDPHLRNGAANPTSWIVYAFAGLVGAGIFLLLDHGYLSANA